MSIKSWLVVSLVANVVLAGWLAIGSGPHDSATPGATTALLPKDLHVPGAPAQEKMVALAMLEDSARAAHPVQQGEFWKPRTEADEQASADEVEKQLDAMRAAVIARYGAGAVDDPAFTRLFKPLDTHYPYLSSKSQIALAKLQRQRRQALPASGVMPAGFDPAAAYQREQQFNAALQSVFTPAEYEAYQLRESVPARQLRASGAAASEKEFRDAFKALQEMDADRSAAGYLAGQEKLLGIFGKQRYAQFTATRDPNFAALEGAAAKHQLSRDQTLAAYGAIQEAQMELVRGSVERGNGLARSGPDPQQIFQQRDQKVASLVGDDAGRDLVSAYSDGVIANSLKVMNQAR